MSRYCIVCTAPSNYAHYGVDSCRSCADFYKRTVLARRMFQCRQGDDKCMINQKDRHNCRGCRFAKCAAIGMKFEQEPIEDGMETIPAPMECLICSDPINNSRLGINACRACAAFFKRADAQFDELKCKRRTNDCIQKDPKTSCRKCRLARFREVLSRAGSNFPAIELESEKESDHLQESPKPSLFIDHTSFYDCQLSNTPLLDRIRKGYSYMCVIRKCGETPLTEDYRGSGQVKLENLVLTPASYSSFIQMHFIEREAIIEFANFSFEEFRSLDTSSKNSIISRCHLVIDVLESTYRACHYFPDDKDVRLSGYTTFLRVEDLDAFIDSCSTAIDKIVLMKEFKHTLKRLSAIVRQLFASINPTDTELVALLGLTLWKEENMNQDEHLLELSRRIRKEIMNELGVDYARRRMTEYASRLGNLFCLLMNCEDCAAQFVEDFELFRLMKVWENVIHSIP